MIEIKKIFLRNFLSIGNVEQSIDFDTDNLTLILGENLDLGGNDAGSRNGTGKTTILQGLSYALFGLPINTIKRDNLINRTNGKNMSVTVDFSVRGVDYRITRTRKPNSLKFWVNNTEQICEDDSQGDSRETQDAIERVLGMTSTMFQHIIGLNSYTTPFLSMKVGDQREVIEQLLGITLLSEKAEAIKELNRKTKEDIQREQFKIHAIEESNKRIGEQISALKRRQTLWSNKREGDLAALAESYSKLSELNIEGELAAHLKLQEWSVANSKWSNYSGALVRRGEWDRQHGVEVVDLQSKLDLLSAIDFEAELQAHRNLAMWVEHTRQAGEITAKVKTLERDIAKEQKNRDKLEAEIATLLEHRCYACGQEFHDQGHVAVLGAKRAALGECMRFIEEAADQVVTLRGSIPAVGDKPAVHFPTESEAVKHQSAAEALRRSLAEKLIVVNPHSAQVAELLCEDPGPRPATHYPTEKEAVEHAGKLQSVIQQIESKSAEVDPYGEQISDMERTGIQAVDYTTANELTRVLQHQEYLLDLLTNKKSFVRKRIIEQNLGYLNSRLGHYLDRIGLPHRVVFQNDLGVEITELGRDLDFDSLSRGERNRVILGLSFAFRDIFENLVCPVNLLFIDELVDNGMDAVGLDNALGVLKDFVRKRRKSVWVVSHRDELVSRVDHVLHVVKENGYTTFRLNDEE